MLTLKRIIDLSCGVIGLALLSIPMAIIAFVIKLDSRGPVFFKQDRVGKEGKMFKVWKFRSMTHGTEATGLGVTTSTEDSRITRIGGVLRLLSLDELPQLINVLRGDMSLVGPRPTLQYQVERYDAYQRRRLEAKPGITSLASVKGRNAISWRHRIDIDVWYVDHWSLWLDFKILFKTLWVAFVTREGVYATTGQNDDFLSGSPGTQLENSRD